MGFRAVLRDGPIKSREPEASDSAPCRRLRRGPMTALSRQMPMQRAKRPGRGNGCVGFAVSKGNQEGHHYFECHSHVRQKRPRRTGLTRPRPEALVLNVGFCWTGRASQVSHSVRDWTKSGDLNLELGSRPLNLYATHVRVTETRTVTKALHAVERAPVAPGVLGGVGDWNAHRGGPGCFVFHDAFGRL